MASSSAAPSLRDTRAQGVQPSNATMHVQERPACQLRPMLLLRGGRIRGRPARCGEDGERLLPAALLCRCIRMRFLSRSPATRAGGSACDYTPTFTSRTTSGAVRAIMGGVYISLIKVDADRWAWSMEGTPRE